MTKFEINKIKKAKAKSERQAKYLELLGKIKQLEKEKAEKLSEVNSLRIFKHTNFVKTYDKVITALKRHELIILSGLINNNYNIVFKILFDALPIQDAMNGLSIKREEIFKELIERSQLNTMKIDVDDVYNKATELIIKPILTKILEYEELRANVDLEIDLINCDIENL